MYSSVPTKEFDARIGSAKNMGLLLLFLLFFFLSSSGRNTYQTTRILMKCNQENRLTSQNNSHETVQ